MALVTDAVASAVIGKLVDKVLEYANMFWWPSARSVKAEAEKLQDALPQIRLVLAAVQGNRIRRRNPDFDARMWQFRDAIEAADDVLDEIKYYESEEKIKERDNKVSGPLSGCKRKLADYVKNAFVNDGIFNKLREALKGLESIASHVGPFLQLAKSLDQQLIVNNFRETGLFLTENTVIGRGNEKEEIVEWLIAEPNGRGQGLISVFSIFGMGGMGKTTLTQLVCEDQRVIENFEPIVWICVSDNSEIVSEKTIIKKIIENISKQSCDLNFSTLQSRLKEKITSKKFLLVLDDVWRDDTLLELKKIMALLKFGESGSKILVTTRMESVAKMVTKVIEGENKYLNLGGLEENDFLALLYRHAFAGTDPNKHQYLHEIGKQIANKLWACPLAAKVIGGVLNMNLNFGFWNKILKEDILNIEASNDNIMEILKLSYYHLPTHLQLCFRYCSIFRQDHTFEKEELVKMWMGSGLIPEYENERRRPEDVGYEYLDQLTRKSFFNLKSDIVDDRFKYFIHDLLHDLAQCVSKGECLRITSNISINIPRTIRHLYIVMENNSMLRQIRHLNKVQTLVIYCNNYDLDLEQELNTILSVMKSLRLLSLDLKIEQKIPTIIGDLIHLRYLAVFYNEFGFIRHEIYVSSKLLYKLYLLQVANVKIGLTQDTRESIMEDMCNLINLRYCKFDSSFLEKNPRIGKLSSLQELNLCVVTNNSGSSTIRELKYLTGLQKLRITGLSNISNPDNVVAAEINKKEDMQFLMLDWPRNPLNSSDREEEVADNLKAPTNLNKLSISGYSGIRSPCWMNDNSYCNLTFVELSYCSGWEHLPPLGQLKSLKSLKFNNMYAVKQVGYSLYGNSSGCAFPSLRQLQFLNMPEWVEWIRVEDKTFPCLEKLLIAKCPKLKRFPSDSRLFPSLRQLEFNEMLELEEWTGLDDELLFPCLDEMVIRKCPKLTRLPTLPPSLRCLEIVDTTLDALPLFHQIPRDSTVGTSVVTLGFSLSKLLVSFCPNIVTLVGSQLLQQPEDFRALEILSIKECRNLLHMPMEFLRNLLSLTNLTVMNCPKLTACEIQLPTMLKSLQFGLCGDLERSFTRSLYDLTYLIILHLHGCASLQTLPPALLFSRMTRLHQLEIKECKELSSLDGIEVLTALKRLYIMGCEKLIGLSLQQPPLLFHNNQVDLARHNIKINRLEIDHSSLLLMEPLRSLRYTKYLDIHQTTSMPGQWLMQNRFTLESFYMKNVSSLQSLPSSMKDLCTLQSLYILGCKMLKSLPNLPPSLNFLYIDGCHRELADLYENKTGRYWSMISHIPEVYITPYEEPASPP